MEGEMASQALYLKWRPQRFEDVVGQEHVTTTLKNALRAGRTSHAYLFSGPRGTGKTTMARLLAKAVNCLDEDLSNRPCNECHICRSINDGRLLDLIEMDAASHTGVDNVRDAIRDKVAFRPTEARYKVYVIDEVHMLSTSAFNALLKTLEEPPEHVIFCLATTEPHKILPTILSRCQQFDFHRIPLSALVARLHHIAEQEGLQVEPEALRFMARMSTGCARDAISLLDQLTAYGDELVTVDRVRAVLGLSDGQVILDLLDCLAAHDVGRGLDVIHEVVEHGADMRQFAQQVVEYLRSTLLLRLGGREAAIEMDVQTKDSLAALAKRLTTRDLVQSVKLFNQAQLDMRGSDQNQLALELAFVEAALVEQNPVSAFAVAEPVEPPIRPPKRVSQSIVTPSRAAAPAAPSRSRPRAAPSEEKGVPGDVTAEQESTTGLSTEAVSLEEVELNWGKVRQAIRTLSRQVEALVNSSTVQGIEDRNRLVLEFASDFLSSKLGKEENRRIVEQALGSVLGKPCRVRGTVRGTTPRRSQGASAAAAMVEEVIPSDESEPPDLSEFLEADPYQDPASDPVIQDLVDRGGRVTDVQVLPEE
jgi:DNA polymerase-3 subunit gamma/tau